MTVGSPAPRILQGEDGYRLWLRYDRVPDEATRSKYASLLSHVVMSGNSDTLSVAGAELQHGLGLLLGQAIPLATQAAKAGAIHLGTPDSSELIREAGLQETLNAVGAEGYVLTRAKLGLQRPVIIAANTDIGLLYGAFALLRSVQTLSPIEHVHHVSAPRIRRRLLNHWDNLDGTVERGYAGFSLWDWYKLPDYLSPRYTDYARANASIGINGTVLTNVNAHALLLTLPYLRKVAALAQVFRPYGIRVYLSARFSAPLELGDLPTADPLDVNVRKWWQTKAQQIYDLIPDFGGFLVKANSEGQPGPHDYKRRHVDGANLLAQALQPYGGVVIWRAFVYDSAVSEDRHKQAYLEFVPQDGEFEDNAFLQVKNGPIDFQPREPVHPLFGAMPETKLFLEFQITQEYLGNATHLVYLGPLFKETLGADTYARGPGSTVAKVVDGSLEGHSDSGIAGVSNIGSEVNWCGHPFAAANWYAFGRLAWDPALSAEAIAEEWLRMTFSNDERFVEPARSLMLSSREAVVDYMTPLGLHHIMAWDHHQGPGPWADQGRPDWTSPYYHRADLVGLGANRTRSGTNAIEQYAPEVQACYADPATCPEELILWFHHVPWRQNLKSGRSLWQEVCFHYARGVVAVRSMQNTWESLARYVDDKRALHVRSLLRVQEKEACAWRDACVQYFQTFSQLPLPEDYEKPEHALEYYRTLTRYYVPGIPERRFPLFDGLPACGATR